MEKAAMDSGKLLMIGFVRRFGNDTAILKDFIDAGDMGEIYYAKASYLRRNGCPGGWFSDSSISGGGPLIDLGVHVIDLVRYLMGCPQPVSVYGATFSKLGRMENVKQSKGYVSLDQSDVFDVEDLAAAMIRFDNGAVLYVDTSFSLNIKGPTGLIDIFGTKSGARIDPNVELFSRMNDYLVDISPAGDTALSFTGLFESQVAHFIDCVCSGRECRSPAKDGVALMGIIDGIYRSATLGREVRFQEEES